MAVNLILIMPPPGSDLEKAVHYAVLNGDSIETSSQLDDDKRKEQYMELLDQVDSPRKVEELQLRFEGDRPYFQLCDDRAIASYFSRWGVPITTKRDLDLFSDALAEKVMDLATSDEILRTKLEQRNYRRQLEKLPAALASLEQTLSQYDVFKPDFKTIMRYVWEAVTLHGFEMKEDGSKATEQYKGVISIQPCGKKAAYLKIVLGKNDTFELYLNPIYETKVLVPAKKRRFWFDIKEEVEVTGEIEAIEVLPTRFFNHHYKTNTGPRPVYGDHRCCVSEPVRYCLNFGKLDSEIFRTSPENVVNLLRKISLGNLDIFGESFQTYLRLVLNLPRLMSNYANKIEESMEDILQQASEQTNESSE